MVTNLPAMQGMQEIWVRSLGQEDPPEEGMEIHSNILAWRSLWIEEPGRLQFMGFQRVGQDRATTLSCFIQFLGPIITSKLGKRDTAFILFF